MMKSIFKACQTTQYSWLYQIQAYQEEVDQRLRIPRSKIGFFNVNFAVSLFRFQEKKQRRSKKLDSGNLREISKLLASEGTVAGRGEIIEKDKTSAKSSKSSSSEMKNRRKKAVMVDNVTQVDSITLEFEIAKQYGMKGGSSLVHKVKDMSVSRYVISWFLMLRWTQYFSVTPAPRHLAAQLIRRLETHKRIQDKEVTSCCNNILYPELSPRDWISTSYI